MQSIQHTMSEVKLVIFDWDGTLFNSIDTIVKSIFFAADKFRLQVSEQQAKDVIGLALPIALKTALPNVPHLEEQILQTYIEHNIPASAQDTWFDGAFELLTQLKAKGYLLAVATGKARKGLDRVLHRMQCEDLFVVTRCADEAESKPSPLMLQQILDELGLQAHQAIMVGDSSYDLEMAQNIQMPSIGVTYGVHSAEVLQQFHPIQTVDSVEQLARLLLGDIA